MINRNMEVPKLAVDIERRNLYYIYLFHVEGRWWTFGYSAYYLSMMYPTLEAIEETSPEYEEGIPCVHLPDSYLLQLSEFYDTLVSDTYVQISAPPTVYSYRKEYNEWCETLAANEC